jgi:hypothetical protein
LGIEGDHGGCTPLRIRSRSGFGGGLAGFAGLAGAAFGGIGALAADAVEEDGGGLVGGVLGDEVAAEGLGEDGAIELAEDAHLLRDFGCKFSDAPKCGLDEFDDAALLTEGRDRRLQVNHVVAVEMS